MDLDGIDAAFLYPSMGLFAGAVHDPVLAAAMCRAYNRWLADYCKPYPDRLFGIAMLPLQSIDLAIAEMRYARRELGMRRGFLRAKPLRHRLLHDPAHGIVPAQLLDLVRTGGGQPQGARRIYWPAQDPVGDRLPAPRRLLSGRAGNDRRAPRRCITRGQASGHGRRRDGVLRPELT